MGRSHRYRAALLSANKAGAYTAMPIFTYFAVVGSVLIALLFVADATLEKGSRAVVTSERVGLATLRSAFVERASRSQR